MLQNEIIKLIRAFEFPFKTLGIFVNILGIILYLVSCERSYVFNIFTVPIIYIVTRIELTYTIANNINKKY